VGVPSSTYPGQPLEASNAATLYRAELTFKQANKISALQLLTAGDGVHIPNVQTLFVAVAPNASATPRVFEPTKDNFKSVEIVISAGGWCAHLMLASR
jgi:hypothetical protein